MEYTLRFPNPETHYVEVEARIPAEGRDSVELFMAVWTPGSYMIREYSGLVESVTAEAGGKQLRAEKIRKNRWRIATLGNESVTLRYRVWCRDMSVRTNWVERDFALLNGAPTFISLAPESDGKITPRPHIIRLELPSDWKTVATGLPSRGRDPTYVAPDFDTLVDSPILAGNPRVYEFKVDGKSHQLVNEGEAGAWDGQRAAKDTEKIVREFARMWGGLPYDRYVFLNLLTEAGGGLEHKNSTVLMASRWAMADRKSYLKWLELVAHEFFHVWNVKRLRPVALGPFDYETEVYTPSLWFAEGVTDYYGTIGVCRAGLAKASECLGSLSEMLKSVETAPGRMVQPLDEASYDAWIKYYRRNPNSPNTTISYYTKGAAVAFLLDAHLRKSTGGKKSLDDVLKEAYRRYSAEDGYTEEQLRDLISEVAGKDLKKWLSEAIDATTDLSYDEALDYFGLRFKPAKKKEKPTAYLGVKTRTSDGRLLVSEVRTGTPAFRAGLNVDDEIVAIEDFRVPEDGLSKRLEAYKPGQTVTILVARRQKLLPLEVTLGETPEQTWELEILPKPGNQQKKRLAEWLGAEPEPKKPSDSKE